MQNSISPSLVESSHYSANFMVIVFVIMIAWLLRIIYKRSQNPASKNLVNNRQSDDRVGLRTDPIRVNTAEQESHKYVSSILPEGELDPGVYLIQAGLGTGVTYAMARLVMKCVEASGRAVYLSKVNDTRLPEHLCVKATADAIEDALTGAATGRLDMVAIDDDQYHRITKDDDYATCRRLMGDIVKRGAVVLVHVWDQGRAVGFTRLSENA